jgi:hypothetical protein
VYQIEVKRQLVVHRFSPSDGWEVTVDLDPMEMGVGEQQPESKREIAGQCRDWLRQRGVRLGTHPTYNRADVVATHPDKGTHVFEVEGVSSRQPEQAVYSALGQVMLAMTRFADDTAYGVAVSDLPWYERQLRKVPVQGCRRLDLSLMLVSSDDVRLIELYGES